MACFFFFFTILLTLFLDVHVPVVGANQILKHCDCLLSLRWESVSRKWDLSLIGW